MSSSRFLAPAIVASLCLAPATRAAADAGDFVAGAIVGGILGHATAQPRRVIHTTTTPHRTYRSQRSTIPATAEGRQIQSSLNYFGFDAGAVDGQLGSRSRGAISTYQAYMGYPATGQLTPFEQELLVSSYNRAQAGGYATQQVIAQTPDGTRGLLKRYRSEMAGQGATYAAQPAPFQPGAAETMVVAPMPSAPVAAPAAAPAAPAPAATEAAPVETVAAPATVPDATLPNLFGGTSRSGGSLASHCNEVSLLTSTNGGFLTEAAMGEKDADTVLSEQFCLARTYSIARGEALMRDLDATPDQVAENCSAYGEMLAPQVSALSIKEADAVLGDVQAVALRSGVPASDLEGTAEILPRGRLPHRRHGCRARLRAPARDARPEGLWRTHGPSPLAGVRDGEAPRPEPRLVRDGPRGQRSRAGGVRARTAGTRRAAAQGRVRRRGRRAARSGGSVADRRLPADILPLGVKIRFSSRRGFAKPPPPDRTDAVVAEW